MVEQTYRLDEIGTIYCDGSLPSIAVLSVRVLLQIFCRSVDSGHSMLGRCSTMEDLTGLIHHSVVGDYYERPWTHK